jgi:hypothetical protein
MTTLEFTYDFAESFSKYPGGRYRRHGPFSGEEFRDDVLMPLVDKHKKVKLNLTGTYGFGSSFIDEAFGEMGKKFGVAKCRDLLIFISEDDPALVDLIWAKIAKAAQS